MELLEFKHKMLKLCNVSEIKDFGNVLMEIALNHNQDFYNKYLEIVDDTKDWLQALWQYYEADRADKKQDYTPKAFVALFLHWQEIVIASMIVAAAAVHCLLIC